MDTRLMLSIAAVMLISIPISRSFEYVSPGVWGLLIGGLCSMLAMPMLVFLIVGDNHSKLVRNTAMFASIFNFASAIDIICALENDDFLTGYMSTYLRTAEPYLDTSYGTAICYWDGIIHCILINTALWFMSKGNARWREPLLLWFGSFWLSMLVLLGGAIIGPFSITPLICLNVPYLVLPVIFLVWTFRHNPNKMVETQFSSSLAGTVIKYVFVLYFILATGLALLRGLGALNVNREIVSKYMMSIEKHILHPAGYCRMTVLIYMFYFIPFYVYVIYSLISDRKTACLVDLSLIHAGAAANAQCGYIGQAFVAKLDISGSFNFIEDQHRVIFWSTNVILSVMPILFVVFNYCNSKQPGVASTSIAEKKRKRH